jgi:hypothetical protein
MPAENTGMIDWLKSLGENLIVFTAPFVVIIWKSFEYLNKKAELEQTRQEAFVTNIAKQVAKEVVKEVLDSTLPDIQRNIQEIKKESHESFKQINDRIDDVILNIKK